MSEASRRETMARARELFAQAHRLPRLGDRKAFLDQHCGADGVVRRLVEDLLRAHDGVAGFLDHSVTGESLDSCGVTRYFVEEL